MLRSTAQHDATAQLLQTETKRTHVSRTAACILAHPAAANHQLPGKLQLLQYVLAVHMTKLMPSQRKTSRPYTPSPPPLTKDDALSPPVVAAGERPESLLPCCVPVCGETAAAQQ